MLRKLKPYQLEAIEYVTSRPHAGLFLDMGLGKTTVMLHALSRMQGKTLLVGPIRVIENVWRQEAKLWPEVSGLRFSLLRGSKAQRRKALKVDADIYLVNPELMHEPLEHTDQFTNLVIDESSMFKNQKTRRFKTLRFKARHFARRYILTGTPTPNSLVELWPQIFILDLGERLDTSFGRFQKRYFFPTDYLQYNWEPFPSAEEKITETLSDIILRMDGKDVLPPREVVENPIYITLPDKARKQYKELKKEAFLRIMDSEITALAAVAVLGKLRQIASGFVYDDKHNVLQVHKEKIQATREILEETSDNCVLVYQYKHELAALEKEFPEGKKLYEGFQTDWDNGKIRLLFIHPQSAAHGLNLQYASHTMIFFTPTFSSEQTHQVRARLDRQGQEHPVIIHKLIAKNTVDEFIEKVLKTKTLNQDKILGLIKEYANA